MPSIKAASLISGTVDMISLNNKLYRIRTNQIDGLTPAEVEAKFNLWVAANLDQEPFKAFLHCYTNPPLVVKLFVTDKTQPDPPDHWWGTDS
jgi:hypothetical protein